MPKKKKTPPARTRNCRGELSFSNQWFLAWLQLPLTEIDNEVAAVAAAAAAAGDKDAVSVISVVGKAFSESRSDFRCNMQFPSKPILMLLVQ